MDITTAQERPDDHWEVEALYDLCFAPGRTALSSYRLRDGVDPVAQLCLVARDGYGQVAGAIRHWPVCVGGKPAVLLGPVAVHPTHQGEGIAALLIWRCLEIAAKAGHPRMMLVGDEPYYGRFGFRRLTDVTMPPPTNPDRVLGIALRRGGWDGVTGSVTPATDCK
ncbi:Predicted N-acetyltransferase YhbS [Loktanella sp. DSM 29012]|uniref:GNAT family N-acetyltransferase n=1 Tax=Loktanella sp. DSM 29012 TaxID=1881056 RepID=UPI0008B1083E|nr:N-acetyltransferase [Loktanella sp. DSM 29012]SEP79781.1 Predicted N-acetyltransferase YhbS [Loktanella sp. DSM 29012]